MTETVARCQARPAAAPGAARRAPASSPAALGGRTLDRRRPGVAPGIGLPLVALAQPGPQPAVDHLELVKAMKEGLGRVDDDRAPVGCRERRPTVRATAEAKAVPT